MDRRGFLRGILAAGVAPALVGSSVLMPIRALAVPTAAEVITHGGNQLLSIEMITAEVLRKLHQNMQFVATVNRPYEDSDRLVIRIPNQYHVS